MCLKYYFPCISMALFLTCFKFFIKYYLAKRLSSLSYLFSLFYFFSYHLLLPDTYMSIYRMSLKKSTLNNWRGTFIKIHFVSKIKLLAVYSVNTFWRTPCIGLLYTHSCYIFLFFFVIDSRFQIPSIRIICWMNVFNSCISITASLMFEQLYVPVRSLGE